MLSLHKKETCGRYVPRPESKPQKDEVELFEEAVPISQQIENLRTKISLQERYNAALQDSLEESAKGSYQVLRDMLTEVYSLRIQVKEAVNKEKWAVNNALRTHRLFQLALKYTAPGDAVDWMEDKLFDAAKVLDNHIDRLEKKRKRLVDTELAVALIEKWPVPGSLPWEILLDEKQRGAENAQANVRLKMECAKVMRNTYRSIRHRLRLEKDLYAPIIRNLSVQLSSQISELKNLEEMLSNAQKFQKEAEETLEWTEKEASANRKQRRAQIAKMRKEMQKMIQEEQMSMLHSNKSGTDKRHSKTSSGLNHDVGGLYQYESLVLADDAEIQQQERLAQKRDQIATYNDHAALLVDVMKIPNLIHIPARMEDVLKLSSILSEEIESKENLKDVLIRQRDQLTQLFCVIRYTGNKEMEQSTQVIQDYEKTLEGLKKSIESQRNELNQDASLMADILMGVSSLLQRIEGMDKKSVHIQNTDHLYYVLSTFHEKLKALSDTLKDTQKEFRSMILVQGKGKTQDYRTPARFVRVGEPVPMDGSDDEDYEDYRVPGRQELKQQSEKLVQQGMLRRGFAAARRADGKFIKSPRKNNDNNNRNTAAATTKHD